MTLEEYFGDWVKVIDRTLLTKTVNSVNCLYATKSVMPDYSDIFKAFTLTSLHDLKVIFLGQDPYPQLGVATGVLFGNKSDTKELSPSLEVIKEASINYEIPHNPYLFDITLESWARQGILMLNSSLTVEANRVGSHTMIWRPFIAKLLENISAISPGIIYVLFGSQAQTFTPYINSNNTIIKVPHPAYYARLGTKMPYCIFTNISKLCEEKFGEPIQWFTYV